MNLSFRIISLNLAPHFEYSKHIDEELNYLFKYPIGDSEEYRLFDILNKAYLDAHYQDGYYIDLQDLKKLLSKVEKLEFSVKNLCKKRITELSKN